LSDSPHTPGELLDFPPHLVPRALIGEGAFARVTAALDATGQEVAVKILSPNWAQDTEACWRFAAEFRRLQRLNGLGFPRALEQGLTPAGRPYYVMSRVFGEPLVPTRPLSATDVRARLSGVAAVLSAVHDLGWVHGDVKSQNLILTPQGELVMLDVGLMASVGQRPEVIAGTLEYLAPEAWRRAPLQPSRDVYALGVLGYRLWTGQLPFAGGPAALAKGHLQAMPVPAQELARDSDAGLARILACLLDKDPTARPADARGVAALLAGDEGKQPRALRLASGGFVGRREVLERWQGALLASGSTWLGLWGHTGVGKSYALDALIPLTRVAGWTWMGVACLAGGAAAALARAVVTKALALAGTPPVGPLAAWLVGEIAPEWWALEPVSRKVVIFSVAASALATAANVLGGLAIALDDAQLADSASQDFLAFMQRVEQLAPIAWVLTGPARLASWPADSPEVTLAPFTPGEVAEHLQFRLGSQPPDRLWQELGPLAGGNPLAIDTLLDHLVASGQLRGDGGHWELAGLALPTDLGTVWHARVETLDALTRRVAAALHTSHGEIPAAWLATSLQVSEASVADALDGLLACGMAVQGAQGPRLASDLFGELFSPAATPSERAHWATEWARRLLGMANPAAKPSGRSPLSAPGSETTDFDALMHAASLAIDGDDPAFALRLAGEAAARAFGMGAPFEAHGLAGRALALRDAQTARELLLPLFLARAEAGRFLDRLQEATTDYEAALACSPAPQARLTALVGLAKCVQMKGDYANATELLRQAEGLAITLEDPAQCARVVSTLARLEVFGGNLEQAERHGERSVSLARQAGVPSILAQVLTLQGNVCFQRDLGRAPEARAILAEALALSESLGDRVGEGMANDALGNLYMALGELSAAASAFERFASVCALAGLATEGLMADLNAGIAAGDAADWRRSLAHGESVAARARAAGRRFVLGAALAVVGQGRWLCGDVAGCEKPLDEALELALTLGNAVLETLVRLVRLEVALGLGDVAMATSEAECLGVLTARTAQVEASGRLAARKAQLALLRGDRACNNQ
jgi:tetratricopeptide (TPR) repeat protein